MQSAKVQKCSEPVISECRDIVNLYKFAVSQFLPENHCDNTMKTQNVLVVFCLITTLVLNEVDGSRRRKHHTMLNGDNESNSLSSPLKEQRKGKFFSLFNVVKFKNDQCTALSASTVIGVCVSAAECTSQKGTEDGSCAAGFGVCCVFSESTCGSTVTRNCTYIRNEEFPSPANLTTGSCAFTLGRPAGDICQIRLDFENLVTAGPPNSVGAPVAGPNSGVCGAEMGDTLAITTPAGLVIPTLCGTLTGQHMYLETGDTGNAAELDFTIGARTAMRTFNIKATFLECTSLTLAPAGCAQYFTEATGSFQSYNFQGGQILSSLDYNTCIRRADGFCSVNYKESAATGTADSFDLFDDGTLDPVIPAISSVICAASFIEIPSLVSSDVADTGRRCGGFLANIGGQIAAGVVNQAGGGPFVVRTFTLPAIGNGAPDVIRGYSLEYAQMPC